MFGFGIFKILFTIAVVIAIWYGFKHISRIVAGAKRALESDDAGDHGEPVPQSLVQCPVCGTYNDPVDAKRCDRDDCPYTS